MSVSLRTPHLTRYTLPDLPSASSILPGIPAVALSNSVLLTIGGIIAVGMIITQSQNKTGTRTHIAHLGIRIVIHTG